MVAIIFVEIIFVDMIFVENALQHNTLRKVACELVKHFEAALLKEILQKATLVCETLGTYKRSQQ